MQLNFGKVVDLPEEEQQQLLTLLKRLIDQVPDPKCTSYSNITHQERM